MAELDKLDCKILYELGEDARQSYKQIAKKINSKKEVVAYHLQQLIKKGVITKFVPVFALSRMSVFSSKIYLRLHDLTEESEKRLYEELVKDGEIAWAAKCVGRWDLLLGTYSRDIIEFAQFKEKILAKFGKHIKDYEITQIADALVFNRDYLTDKTTAYRKEFVFAGEVGNVKLKDNELKIIQLIKNNARFAVLDLAEKIKLDPRTVIRIIRELQDKEILQGYTTFIDLKKLGLQLHKLCIYLENYDKKQINKLIETLKQNPKTIHLIKALGPWELEIEIEESDLGRIYDYIKMLKNTFPKLIKQIDLASITEELKLDFFPEKVEI